MTQAFAVEPWLDVAPMIRALKFQPSDFELSGGWLRHVPSRHRFKFGWMGRVSIDAHCGCALLSARPDQERDLQAAFDAWRTNYWSAIATNREFASHFAPVGRLRRFARDIRMAFRRLRGNDADPAGHPAAISVPAE